MGFQAIKASGALEIVFSGKLNIDTVPNLLEGAITTLNQEHPLSLVLDFKDVDYCKLPTREECLCLKN